MLDKSKEKEIFDKVVKYVSHNEKIAWKRRHKNLTNKIRTDITPIEEEIMQLSMKKWELMDAIEESRQELVKSCVHPREFLVLKDDHVLCKFCQAKIKVNVE